MERDLSEFLDKIDAAEAENLESVYLYDKAYDEGYADGYKQAVDEFLGKLKKAYKPIEDAGDDMCRMVFKRFDKIAEQMKGGAE